MDEADATTREDARPQPMPQRPRLPLHILVGLLVGIVLAIYAWRTFLGDGLTNLTRSSFEKAESRWKAANIADYQMKVKVRAIASEIYDVTVRNGRADSVFRNGEPLTQRRTMHTWTVPGMFDTIRDDLDSQEQALRGVQGKQRLTLRAKFDTNGVPIGYHRIEQSSPVEVTWEVSGKW